MNFHAAQTRVMEFRKNANSVASQTKLTIFVIAVTLLAFFASAAHAQTAAPCCVVTAIELKTEVAVAKVNANSDVFEFKLTNPKLLADLRVGQGVYANFRARQVSLDGKTIAGTITGGPQAPAAAPAHVSATAASRTPLEKPASSPGSANPPSRAALPASSAAAIAQPASKGMSGSTTPRATGLKPPPLDYITQQAAHQNAIATQVLRLEQQAMAAFEKSEAAAGRPPLPETILRKSLPAATATSFDWTNLGKVTPIRDQGNCGSCWDFATLGALESSVLIRYNMTSDLALPRANPATALSEQYILDDAIFGGCSYGGWQGEAATEMMLEGTAKESDLPYVAEKQSPRLIRDNPYRALIWGFVGDGISPSVAQLKEALLAHGPLAVSVIADGEPCNGASNCNQPATPGSFYDYFLDYQTFIQAHPDKVLRDGASGLPDHVVLLVGWDDHTGAWRIKNSWGSEQGDNGFGWIAYGANKIGFGAIWVEASNSLFPLPPEIQEWLNKAKKLAQDAEQEERALAQQADREMAQAQAAADQAKSAAQKAAADAAEKARVAGELAKIAAEKQKEIGTALSESDKKAKEAAAKAAQSAADAANADAAKAKSAADHTAAQAQDAANSAAKEIATHFPALPDPRKHLPKL